MGMAMHGKDREAIEDRRDAMSGSLFSSEVVRRALVFLLSQPLLFTHNNLSRPWELSSSM